MKFFRFLVLISLIFNTFGTLGVSTASAATDLMAHWKFDETSGTTAADSSGNNNTGTLLNGPTWTTAGKLNGALNFDGTNDRVNVPHSTSLALNTNAATLAAWVRLDTNSRSWITVIERDRSNLQWMDWQIYARASDAPTANRPVCRFDWDGDMVVDADEQVQGNITLATSTWYHLACTYDGSAIRFYIDGTLRGTTTAASKTIRDSGRAVSLGGNEAWGEYLDGQIDDARVYNRALSQTEIQAIMAPTQQYTLTVNTAGSGTVTKNPDKASYNQSETVQLTATPAAGWSFSGWSGSLTGSANPATVTMDANKTITATFTQNQYSLSVNVVGNGTVTKNPDKATYTYGETVQLTATPSAGWTFSGWSGDLSGSANPATITVNGNKSVTATFAQIQYALTVNVVGSGTVAKVPDKTGYNQGESVQLTATPAAGWSFAGWSGALSGADNPATILMDGAKTVTATFTQNQYALTVDVNPAGSGTVSKNPDKPTYTYGETVQLTATPAEGFRFSGWSGGTTGSANPVTVSMDTSKNVTATFTAIPTYSLVINTAPGGSVTKSPDQEFYLEGSQVQLTAHPEPGMNFSGWSGDLSGSDNPATITIDGNKTISANFSANQYSLSITVAGSGSVTKNPDKTSYAYNEEVELTAISGQGWTFGGWSGDLSGSSSPITIKMDANKAVTATFTQDQYTLSVNVVGSGSVSKTPDKATYTYGETVQLKATSQPGWSFTGWSGDAGGTSNPVSITMDGNKTVTANFSELPKYTLSLTVVGNGSITRNPDKVSYYQGESVELSALPDSGWAFAGWSGDLSGSASPQSLTMDGNKAVTATFSEIPPEQYTLNLSVVGSGSVTKAPDQATYEEGTSVQLTATPQPGWSFTGWSGSLTGTDNPVTVVMDGNKSVTATFAAIPYTVTINIVGSGTVTRDPEKATYSYGESVSLTATPALGWTFAGWSGDAGGSDNPASLSIDSNKTVTATFSQNTYTLAITPVGSGSISRNPDKSSYTYGESVQLTATSDPGWTFSAWSGALSGNANPVNILMDEDKAVTAIFLQDTYTLTVNTIGSGTVTKNPDQAAYVYGNLVQLTAVPAAGWRFTGWSGDLSGSASPADLTMNGNKTVTATFTRIQHTLTVTVVGSGSVTKVPDQSAYDEGATVQLTAAPAAGWTFSGWSGDLGGKQSPVSITMDADRTVTATFTAISYSLTVNITGNGSVTLNPDKPSYVYGETVQLTANPAAGWNFNSWSGDLNQSSNPATITIDGDKTVTATFSQDQYTLTVNVVGNGSVTKNPDHLTYIYGDTVQLTASPAAGWAFTGWSGALSGSTNPANLAMDGNKTVTATFTRIQHTLTVTVVGSGSVTKNPNQAAYDEGTVVQLTASPAVGWIFSGWSGDLAGSTSPVNVTMDSNKAITANFTQSAYTLTINTVGSGSVTKNPDKTTYVYGDSVQLTATPQAGWTFSGWSGDLTGTTNPATLAMNGSKTVTATFTRVQYTLAVTIAGSGSVTKVPDQVTYNSGDVVQLTAAPATGWQFSAWSGALTGSTNPASITMDSNKAVTATFTQTPSANLVGHYKFDETSGTVAADSSGNNNPGTLQNGPTWTTGGKLNGALNLDGSNDRVTVADSTSLHFTSNRITLAAWVMADTVTQSWTTVIQRSRTGLNWMDWQIYARASDAPTPNRPVCRFDFDGDSVVDTNEQVQGDIILAANTWYHLACTYDGSALRFYIDGTLRGTTTSANQSIVNSTRPIWIGGNEAWGEYFDGQIDDTRIYNRALSQAEIQAAMNPVPQYTLTVSTVGSGSVTRNPDKSTYNQGETVQLTAAPAAGWSFGAWSGALSGSANPASITMDANKAVTATFTQNQYTLTVNVTGNGSVTRNPDKSTYTNGEVVQLTATPDAGYRFTGWSGDLSGTTNPANLTIDGNKTVTAAFAAIPTYTLTVTAVGGGSVTRIPDQASYLEGTVVQLTANPDAGKMFDSWSGDVTGTSNPISVTMNGNKTVTATFNANQYTLAINVVGSGSIAKVPNRASYAEGETVQLTATPATGWVFAGWSGDLTGSDNPTNISMTSSKTVTATFTAIPYILTITTAGSGSVVKNPDALTYKYGDVVTLTAVPAAGWKFSGWSGDLTGTTSPANVTMNGDKTVIATFIQAPQHQLTINITGSGAVSRNPEKDMYDEGETVLVTATPSTGWSFTGWSGDLVGTTNPASIVMNVDKTVGAAFIEIPPTDLVGYWKFDAGSGTSAVDSSMYGNNGTLQNGPTWIAGGKVNSALNFDGTDDRVTVPDSSSLRLTGNRITLAAWVKPDTITQSWSTVMQRSRTGLGWMDWQIYARANDAPTPNRPVCRFDFDGDSAVDANEEVQGDIILAANTWHHLACTYDGTALRFYIDGTLRGTTASASQTIINSTRPVWIGGNEAWGEYFDGQIDDVRIYSRALSEAELKGIAGGNPPPTPHAGICADFETGYTLGQTIGTNTGWYDGGSGPVVNSGSGLGGSVGLAPATNVFTWTAHPFNWNATDFLGVDFQMDYQTDGSGQFDDDRLGWMINNASVDSVNQFGVQLDTSDGGIVTYWRDASDTRVQTPIVPLSNLTPNTWYRLQAKFTKLTATSAKIDVTLTQLDANGLPTGTPYTGTLPDTSLWADGVPPARYFSPTSMWPSYKNINGITGGADNACFNLVSNRFAFVVTSDWHTSSNQSNDEANLAQVRTWLDTPTADMPAPQFMVITGDFPNLDQTQTSITRVLGSSFLWYPVIGNHEVSDNINNFTSIRDTLVPSLPFISSSGPAGSTNTNYSWDFGTAHFVAINAYWDGTTGANADHATDGNIPDALRSWIDTDLDATAQTHKFAFIHEPAYPEARHLGDSLDQYPAQRDAFVTMLDSDQVVALFAGHDHYYHHNTSADQPLLGDLQQINNASFQNFSADDGASITYVLIDGDQVTFKVYRSTTGSPFTLYEEWIAGRSLPTEPPTAPDGLTATAFSSSQINLGWNDNADNEARYEVERSTTGIAGVYNLLATRPVNAVSYSDQNLNPLAEYCYRVRAVNAIGASGYTAPACDTTPNGPSTVTFQDGLNGYASTVDTMLMQSEASTSHANLDMLDWDTDDPSGSGQYNYTLLRFDSLFGANPGQIPVGSTIQSAILHYTVTNTGASANVNEIAVNWAETDTYNNFGGEAGVQDNEYGTARGSATGAATGDQTLDVTASLAAWVNNPAANLGWIFRPTGTDGVDLRSSEYATTAERPRLVVQFTPPGGPVNYTLTVNVTGSGAVTKSPDRAYYSVGETVQLTATPATGWVFGGWSGSLTGSTNPASVTMDGNKTITAAFSQPTQLKGICESFDSGFTLGQAVGTNAGWYDGGSGPVVTSSIGLSSTVGLAPSSAIFNWVAHPFTWNATDLSAISFSMDYQTDGSGQFDDDRLGWIVNEASVASADQFGVQLDHSDGGIVTFWRDASDVRVQTPIVTLPNLTANTWFRLQAKFTKLTAASAKIDVSLTQLDANGLPTGTPYTGTLADTSLWPDGAPPARYFNAASMWPTYKNYSAITGASDNACMEITPGRFAFVVTSDWHTSSSQSNVENNLGQIRSWLDTPTADMPAPQFMVITGDFPNLDQTQTSITRVLGSSFLWYPVIGNHEVSDNINNFNSIRDTFVPSLPFISSSGPTGSTNTTYSWDFGTAHFVAINAYWDGTTGANADHVTDGNIPDALRSWIDTDLDATAQTHKFAFIHEPAYPEARHLGDSLDQYPAQRDAFVTMLDSDQVVALFAGHDHYYHHDTSATQPLLGDLQQINNASFQFLSGEDGASITYVLIDGDQVTFKVYRSTTGSPFTLYEEWTEGGTTPACYSLTLSHNGQGSDPVTSPANSTGCPSGQYLAGASVALSGATPASGWQISSWSGTLNDTSTASTNTVTIPAANQTASVTYTEIPPATLTCESFNAYAPGGTIGTYTGWSDGGSGAGPVVTAGNGVAGSIGLAGSTSIFNWTAHPFNWSAADFQKLVLQQDFQSSSSSTFDDDRLSWTLDGSSNVSNNEFGVQLDNADGGIVTYWRTSGGTQVKNVIAALTGIQANTWYRFKSESTKLTATSVRIDVSLVMLDSTGNPTGTPIIGSIADTALLTGIPNPAYFTTANLTPSYKNFNAVSGAADNVCYQAVTGTPVSYTLTTSVVGSGSITRNPDQASYASGTPVTLTANPAAGWHFVGWTGDLASISNPATITMDSSKNVTATFEINTFTLNYFAGTHGSLTGNALQTVNYGQDGTAVTAVPDSGYSFVDWSDGSVANPRIDANVTASVFVTANFTGMGNRAPDQPALVSPLNGAADVPFDATLSVTPTDPDNDAMTVTFYGKAAAATTFTIAVLPDTQYYSLSYPSTFAAQTQWIVDNRAARNIVFVSHEGDVTNNNSAAEWTNASTAMYKLENATPEIPYGLTLGNHDLPASADFTSTFGVNHFQAKPYYGGHYGSDNLNSYELFSAAGMDFIVVHLSYGPSTAVLTWADGVLKAYPARRAIVTSHDVIDASANFSTNGSNIYNTLKNNANLFLILCGHSFGEARRTDTDSGHTIYTLLADFQDDANGGNGWMRTLEFSPATDEILVKTYSPTLGQSQTDAASEFTLPYDMVPPQTFQVIGTNPNVASGATTSVTWANLPALTPQEWYVTVSDASLSTTSPNWTFTTQAPPCYALTLSHTGNGSDPTASPTNSVGCQAGQFVAGAAITLTASPAAGYQVASWTGTSNDSSTSITNTLTMPAAAKSASVAYVESPVGNYAVQMNGTNSYIRVDNNAELGLQTFTIETWFKRLGTGATASSGSGGLTAVEPLVSKGRSESDNGNIDTNYLFGIQGGKLGADFEECASSQTGCPGGTAGLNHPVTGATTLQDNVWYHGAVTYDGRYWKLYLNGIQDGYVDLGTSLLPRWDSIQPIGIGTAFNSTGVAVGDFNGVIDEVRIWNSVRTQAEIQADMYSENPAGSGLVGHWNLNENAGTVANDTAGTAQNGTLTNNPSWVAGFPQPVCFNLTLSHTGNGSDPAASPSNSIGCQAGQYVNGAAVTLTASPASGYQVASWSGTNNDSSASTSNTLTMPAAAKSASVTYIVSTVVSNALQFNGSSQYVTFGASGGLTPPGLGVQVFTIETWFKKMGAGATTTTGTGGVTAVPIVTKGRGEAENSNVDMNYFFGIDSTGVLTADFEECSRTQTGCPQTTSNASQGGQNYPAKGATVIQNNVWYHAAVTFDGRSWKFYLNGVQDGGTTDTGASRYPRWDSIQHAGIGTAMNSTGVAAGFFNGVIDEPRIWNVVLTQAEIQASMYAELTGGTGLIGRWGLNEGSGTTAANSIAGRPNGTLTGSPTWVAGFPQLTCYTLTLSHTGNGSDPVASPTNSTGCPAGQYVAGASITLSGAAPDSDYRIGSWTGTANDSSTANANTLTMPASAHTAAVNYTPDLPTTGWTAYNDCVYDSTKALAATDPNGQLVHYIGSNVTTFGIGTNFTGLTSGVLVNHDAGTPTGVTATLTQAGGGVVWQPEINSPWNGGYDTAAGTDARTTFGGIADMTGVIYYAPTSGWYVDLTLTGLDPAKTYTFATSASRANSAYTTRISRYTLSGVDGATNASTTGVTVINNLSVAFNTGDNHAAGYVARWTGIQPGADGSITIRAEPDGSEYRAYAFSVFMLKEE